MTGVYGRNNPKERRRLWRELENMVSNFDEPWIVAGETNAVSSSEEKLGGLRPPRVPTLEFRTMISDFNFMEQHKGNRNFTTKNFRKGEARIMAKLDRALISSNWLSFFPYSSVKILSRISSDHHPLLNNYCLQWKSQGAKPLKFDAMWMTHPRFKAISLDLGRSGLDHCGLWLLGNTPSLNEGGTLQEMSSIRTPFHRLFNPYAGFRMVIPCKGWPGNNHHLTVVDET